MKRNILVVLIVLICSSFSQKRKQEKKSGSPLLYLLYFHMLKLGSVMIKTTSPWQSLKEPEEQLFPSLLLSGSYSTKEVTSECGGKRSLSYKCQRYTSNWKRQGGRIIELTKNYWDDFKHYETQGFKWCYYNLVLSLDCALFNDSLILKQVLPCGHKPQL